jgi:hypothetical protein
MEANGEQEYQDMVQSKLTAPTQDAAKTDETRDSHFHHKSSQSELDDQSARIPKVKQHRNPIRTLTTLSISSGMSFPNNETFCVSACNHNTYILTNQIVRLPA